MDKDLWFQIACVFLFLALAFAAGNLMGWAIVALLTLIF